MLKTYKGLVKAIIESSNIIDNNRGADWDIILDLLIANKYINKYFNEVSMILLKGRDSIRFKK